MAKKIKLMHIVFSLECGGLERIAVELSKKLNNGRFDISIYCLDAMGELTNEAQNSGIEVLLAKRRPGFDFTLPIRLAYTLRKKRVDVVHTHNMGPLFYGTLGAKLAGVPVVINTRHGRAQKRTNAYIWQSNDAIVAISQDARDEMVKWNHIPSDKLRVIYNGIDIAKYSANNNGFLEMKRALQLDSAAYIIGTVARLSPEKDQYTLIEAFAEITKKIDGVHLAIVGDGPLRNELEVLSRRLGISNQVHFLGFRKDVADILKLFDVFVLSSLMEGVSLTLLEAMAVAKPVVATDVGGNPEVIVDGVTGFLVPSKDPKKLTNAIIALHNNREFAHKMGEAGRKRVEGRFSSDRMIKEYENLYEECLARKN